MGRYTSPSGPSATCMVARRQKRSRGRLAGWNSISSTRSGGIQKYLPVVVMTSKQEASRSSASRMSVKAVLPAVPVGCGRASSASAASLAASGTSPLRRATMAASDDLWAAVGSPKNSGTRPSLNSCRLASSPRSSWRNSATTMAADGSRSAQASRTVSARSMLPEKAKSSASRTRAPISVGARRTAALAAVSAAARLPSRNRRPASPGSAVPVGESDIDPPDRLRRQTLGAASSVTRWNAVAISSSW